MDTKPKKYEDIFINLFKFGNIQDTCYSRCMLF